MDIPLAIATVTQAIGLARAVKDMDTILVTAEYKGKMADIISAMADVKIALTDAKLKISELESQIMQIKRHSADFIKIDGFSYDKDEAGQSTGDPYCPVCEQREGMILKLHQNINLSRHPWYCGACKTVFGRI